MLVNRPGRWQRKRLRVAAAVFAAIAIAAVGLAWQSFSPAQEPTASLQIYAAQPNENNLTLAVLAHQPQQKELSGTLHLELRSPAGKVLHTATRDIQQKQPSALYSFQLPAKLKADGVTIHAQIGKLQQQKSLAEALLPKGHETSLIAGQEFFTGSRGALQCQVHAIKSVSESIPLPGSNVSIHLVNTDSKESHKLYTGTTDATGQVLANFEVPELPAGQYTLEVVTKSALGEEKLTQAVRIRDDAKVLLITDKPMYQPGQEMHIRALVLRPYDLKPAQNQDLLFEVEDPKGNKVFKRTVKTSDFGVAFIDFQLADEVNMGQYQVRAIVGQQQAQKSVEVKRYVLPKFKVEVTTDKRFYLPKETIRANLQSDYFFGKPVAGGKIKVTASTFDVQFRHFATWEGKTDENGHAKFEITLPDYFVGQPLQKGNAMVKLDVELLDTADHTEKITKTYTVSEQPIQISLIAEGGKLVPDMKNRVFAAAIYPDGSPAQAEVQLWIGQKAEGKPVATVKTNEAGLAEFTVTPKAENFRQGEFGQRKIELLGGQQFGFGPEILFDVTAKAKDGKGNTASTTVAMNAHPLGENVLLRLDKAIYQPGDSLKIDVRSSAGLPTVYIDIVRGGQTVLTRWLDVKDGAAGDRMDLPPELFGTLEVHAYQMLNSGEIIRDSRVVYVQPRNDLNIKVEPDKQVFEPGENGRIRFLVTDSKGNPTQAALGVIIVDEAVYALQDMQPGLEKVYFTLQEELLKPQAQAKFKPVDNLPVLIQQPALAVARQQVAEALLTAVDIKTPNHWQVAPQFTRKQQLADKLQQIGWGMWNAAWNPQQNLDVLQVDKKTGKVTFAPDALKQLLKAQYIAPDALKGPFGEEMDLADLAKLEKSFKPENLAESITEQRIQNVTWWIVHYTNQNKNRYMQNGKWVLDNNVIEAAVKNQRVNRRTWADDAWGRPLKLVRRAKDSQNITGQPQMEAYEVVSAGPDGNVGTKDDIRWTQQGRWAFGGMWWLDEAEGAAAVRFGFDAGARRLGGDVRFMQRAGMGGGFGGAPAPMAAARGAVADGAPEMAQAMMKKDLPQGQSEGGGAAPITRIREYFPETMLWQPALITDRNGVANLAVNFADSITTWRMTASASSKVGGLGGVTVPLKVFQDFFVDIDLPINLTQGDEVAFPVAVYNYLETPQTLKVELEKAEWFELVDSEGLTRNLTLKPNEVTSVRYRIRANKIGNFPLTVRAYGSKKSDAVRRVIEIVPNGKMYEKVISDRLTGNITQKVEIPQDAIPDSYKLLVRVYPGVVAQVMEGMEGMLRLPGG